MHIEYSVTRRDVDKVLDVLFSTSRLNETIAWVLDEAGWLPPRREGRWGRFTDFYAGLDSNAKGALVMAAIGALAIPVVPIVLLIGAWTD